MTEPVNLIDAIYGRRAVRSYTNNKIDKDTILTLLKAGVQAPTAMHKEPWAFAVIQDPVLLKRLTKTSGEILAKEAHKFPPDSISRLLANFENPDFDVCRGAGTLIAIYGKPMGPFVVADCWLAAQNIMLAAYSMGLGTCVIGLSLSALNTPAWKNELGIPAEMTAYAALVLGEPAGDVSSPGRKEPEILAWKS